MAKTIPAHWSREAAFLAGLCLCAVASAAPLADLARAYRLKPTPATHAAVLQFASSHKDTSGALAYLVLGSKELEQKDLSLALKHLDSAAKGLPSLADYPAYLIAATQFEAGAYGEVDRVLKIVPEQHPASPLMDKSVVLTANAYLQKHEPGKAIQLVEKYQADLTPPEYESLLAHSYESDRNPAAARSHYEKILIEFPLSNEAPDAASDPARLDGLAPEGQLARCLHLLGGGDFNRARRELEQLIPKLTGADAELAEVRLGAAGFQARDTQRAYDYLKGLDLHSPEADAERLYWLIRCARRLDRPADFRQPLERLAGSYTTSSWRLQALISSADYFWGQNDAAGYQPLYRVCVDSFGSDPLVAECQWRLAFSLYHRRDPGAEPGLELLVKRYPNFSKVPNALYFLGRVGEKKRDWAAARAWYGELVSFYPNYFYTTLAAERLNRPEIAQASPDTGTVALLRSIVFSPRGNSLNFVPSELNRARSQRAALLASAGLDDLAESELRFGAKTDGQPEVAAMELAELAAQRDAPDLGIRYIKQLAPDYLRMPPDAAPEKFWKLAFPLPFREPLDQYSREHDLDPFLVAGLIRQESEFNPKVVSHANAYGLTQILPSTGREVSRKLGLRGFRTGLLFTPEVNLKIGTYFLRSLLDRLQGNWEATLASYNAGPNRVAKWLAWGEFEEPAEFIETIPFDETRNYVMAVLRNADMYRRLYASHASALASTNGNFSRKDAGTASSGHKPAPALPQ